MKCPICKKEFKTIVPHIKTHSLSIEEFKKIYPNVELREKLLNKRVSETCTKNGCGTWNKGRPCSEERKKKMSILNAGDRNPFYGKKHNKKTKLLMSKNHANVSGDKNPFKSWIEIKDNRTHFSSKQKKRWCKFKETKRYTTWRESVSKRVSNEILSGSHPFSKSKKGYYQSLYGAIYYHSSYELAFLKLCEFNNEIKLLERPSFYITYIDTDGIKHRYHPDYIVAYMNNKVELIEVKPKSLLEYKNNPKKFDAMLKYCREKNIYCSVITEDYLFNGGKKWLTTLVD